MSPETAVVYAAVMVLVLGAALLGAYLFDRWSEK